MVKIYGMVLSHNCEELLPLTFNKIPKKHFYKIFVTDDGSKDNSVKLVKELGFDVTETNVSGYGSNVKNGLKYAFKNGADYVVEIHGDGAQFNPKAVVPALELIKKSYDFIIGSRMIDKKKTLDLKMPIIKFLANMILSKVFLLLLRLPLTECNSGFVIYGPKFKKLNLIPTSDGHLFSFQMLALSSFHRLKCGEVPVECDYKSPHSSLSYKKAVIIVFQQISTIIDYLIALTFNTSKGIFKK